MAFLHKSRAWDPAQEVGCKLCTLQPLVVCWRDDKGRDRQSHQQSPLALSRAALVLVKLWGFEKEAQVCGNNNLQFYSRTCRALNPPSWSSGPLFTFEVIPEGWYNSMEAPSNTSKQDLLHRHEELRSWYQWYSTLSVGISCFSPSSFFLPLIFFWSFTSLLRVQPHR